MNYQIVEADKGCTAAVPCMAAETCTAVENAKTSVASLIEPVSMASTMNYFSTPL